MPAHRQEAPRCRRAPARDNRVMRVVRLSPGATIGAGRGEVVVCIPVYDAYEHLTACLQSVLAHTPAHVPILLCDDASPDPRIGRLVAEIERAEPFERTLHYLRRERNVGFPANVNGAFAAAAPADVVVLNSDCVVAEGWLEGLRDAAYSDSRVATATALTNHGTLVSVPERNRPGPLPRPWTIDAAAAAVRARSLRLRPRLPTAIGHCVYIRRSALELVGELDLAFSPGYGEEVDFSQRCLRAGLCHVAADEVLVAHHGAGTFAAGGASGAIQEQHERLLAARYPHYHPAVKALEEDSSGPLARALSVARRALSGLSVLIDGRVLTGPTTGTHVQVLEVVAALARAGRAQLTVLVPPRLNADAARALDRLPRLRQMGLVEATAGGGPRVDVVHRPYHLSDEQDLALLLGLGERLVITHHDLIAYRTSSYFEDAEAWERYRRCTRRALAAADRVVFVSDHARRDALAEDLLLPERASVVHNGVDHVGAGAEPAPAAPAGAEPLAAGGETILCLGTDFRHKNRVFALRVLAALKREHGWGGRLLFAGPTVAHGSSRAQEARLLLERPELRSAVLDFGPVSEAEKAWLYGRAGVVLYPTVYEGFGLVPFEAAGHGVPCMWAPGTALSEVLPDTAATIVAWDAEQTAARALDLLRDPAQREANVTAVRAAAAGLSWRAAAERLLELYERTCDAPASPGGALARRRLGREQISQDALRLLGPKGLLAPEYERPLLALATHPQLGAPVFAAIRLGYRASWRLKRWARGQSSRARGPLGSG
jgi:glycosyltransferase involved in cell wall biosynthesis/GT2 family glycosyltransferase